ncbi:hypothetical protein LCGC14_2635970 [marine sediment metagenome]|uniref:Uncharacterized protein n=1 Tax=marine sediment metagenome TaxID=412755 RepID=A0A0F9CR90_9ZZZZ
MILHRWEYDSVLCAFVCVQPAPWETSASFRCSGCGLRINDETVYKYGERPSLPWLQLLAHGGKVQE